MRVEVVDLLHDDSSVLLLDELTGLGRWPSTRYLSFLWLKLQLLVEFVFEGTNIGTVRFVIDLTITTFLGWEILLMEHGDVSLIN